MGMGPDCRIEQSQYGRSTAAEGMRLDPRALFQLSQEQRESKTQQGDFLLHTPKGSPI